MEPLSVRDYEVLAEQALGPERWAYFSGGAGDEWTLEQNVAAFRRWVLRPRVLVDVEAVSTRTTVLGLDLALPLLVAPLGYLRMAHPDGEGAMARAAAAAGTVYCLSTMGTTAPVEVAAAAPEAARWFQLYVFKDEGVTRGLVEQAREAGCTALVLTVDSARLGNREGQVRSGFAIPAEVAVPSLVRAMGGGDQTPQRHFHLISSAITWRDVERFAELAGMPVVLKGVMTAEDTVLAVEHGAAAIVVSNHGGRQLDGVAGTLDALPEVVEAAAGRVEVLVDGGVRRGTDVVKALALGARAVLVGRAPLWGLAVDGERGAARVLELLRAEVELALALVGAASPAEVGRGHVGPARGGAGQPFE